MKIFATFFEKLFLRRFLGLRRYRFRFCVQGAHCPLHANGGEILAALNDSGGKVRNLILFFLRQFSEDIVNLAAAVEFVADSYADPGPFVTFQTFRYVFKAVVTSG